MHPLLEKFMMVGFMVAGLCTGAYLFGSGREKTLEELLEEDRKGILDTEAKRDSEEYREWEKKVNDLNANKSEELNEFIKERKDNPGYEVTVEKLQKECNILLVTRGSRGSRDYENAKLFCTEYVEESEGMEYS